LPRRGYRFLAAVDSLRASTGPELKAMSPRRLWRASALTVLALLVLAVLVRLDIGGVRSHLLGKPLPTPIRSIAVLPLENLSRDADEEYFADGMTEALTTDLGRIGGLGGLRVISRTSTMAYKGSRKKTMSEVARELNVDAVVEGAVLRSGNRVRITAQLIQAVPEKHLWAETYERDLQDILTLQTDIARAIANEVQVKLTPQEQARLLRPEPVDPQTYELYLKGRYFWGKRTEPSIQKSIDYFQQAIQRQPHYALAYAAMAEAYVIREDLSPAETYSKAKAAARTALQMDEGLAQAHNALAMCLFRYDWDWAGAEREFQRAIALNPNYAWAHQWYGGLQNAMGRDQNWAAELKRARELDPLPLTLLGSGAAVAVASGQYDLAIEIQRKKLELDPNSPTAYLGLGSVYTLKGMYQEAIAHLQKGVNLSGGAPRALSTLGYTYAVAGDRDKALKIVQQLILLSKRRYVPPYDIARVYMGLDEKDLAFDWLAKAVADRSIPVYSLKKSWELDSIRSDPRFQDLLRRIGLPQN
jgi:TolB-like protein/Flp pilus assembly protein TadD